MQPNFTAPATSAWGAENVAALDPSSLGILMAVKGGAA